jgi:hypothetical protein
VSALSLFEATLRASYRAAVDEARQRREFLRYVDSLLERLEQLHLADLNRVPPELFADICYVCEQAELALPSAKLSSHKLYERLFEVQERVMQGLHPGEGPELADGEEDEDDEGEQAEEGEGLRF